MSITPAETLVERRRRLVRADLARVAVELFAERGFDAVTVDDIAAAAGTSQRTFFRYFATKDDVVLEYERQLWQRLVTALEARPPDEGPVTALREAFRATSHVEPADRAHVVQLGRILDAAPTLRARATAVRLAEHPTLTKETARRMGVAMNDTRVRTVVAAMTARLLPGDGVVDFAQVFGVLDDIGATPFIATEIFNPGIVAELGADRAARAMRDAALAVVS